MRWSLALTLAAAAFGFAGSAESTFAQGVGVQHPASAYYRGARRAGGTARGPRVAGFVQRRVGGYSFYAADTINTYGNSRSLFGNNNVYRHWGNDRQTPFGPFDHGFFFDSGIAPHGGFAPYQN
jgi:hypothetical protein